MSLFFHSLVTLVTGTSLLVRYNIVMNRLQYFLNNKKVSYYNIMYSFSVQMLILDTRRKHTKIP